MKVYKKEVASMFSQIDLFICSSGFEERSKSFSLSLDDQSSNNAIIFHIDENYIISYENLKQIEAKFPHLKTVQHPKNNPLETYDIILSELGLFFSRHYVGSKLSVVIDVTTFTREVLIILFKAFDNEGYLEKSNIRLVYTPAENYPCEWLTKGVRYIRSVFGYAGMILPSKKLMLVILNGFENERTEEIIRSFEPNAILLGKPSQGESINHELEDRGTAEFEHIKRKYSSYVVEEFEFSCIEVDATMNTLEALTTKYENDYNIVLSPLNNKVSTISAAFAALRNESLQICYASANQYNINEYSVASDYFLVFDMNAILRN